VYRNHLPRRESDNYQTSLKLALGICARLQNLLPAPKTILEPSAGLGRFVTASRQCWPQSDITAVEVREECEKPLEDSGSNRVCMGTWEAVDLTSAPTPDLIVGNPPYEFAQEHLELALSRVRQPKVGPIIVGEPPLGGYVAFLLRMAFLNSQARVKTLWDLQKGFRYLMPLAQRPSFTGDGKSEHSEYAVYIFQAGYKGNAEILPHLWVEGVLTRES
jgi:hypothetical protein